MTPILVDSNVILDVATQDPVWAERSSRMLAKSAESAQLVINPIIFAEVSVGYERVEELEAALPADLFRRENLPWEAAFLAGKCFLAYRRRGGKKSSTLPDFYVGAHAALAGVPAAHQGCGQVQNLFPRTGDPGALSGPTRAAAGSGGVANYLRLIILMGGERHRPPSEEPP